MRGASLKNVLIRVSPKFRLELHIDTDEANAADIVGKLYNRHIISIETVGGINRDDFKVLNKSLQRLERFWTDQILYRL